MSESLGQKYQRILSQKKNKSGNTLLNRKAIKKKINRCYRKIHNLVKELHNQTSLYLCRNYDKILIPKFETQKMIKQNIKRSNKNNIKKIKEENINVKEKIRNYSKKCRLNGRVKFVLSMLSHYKFRQQLLNKCQEYGCLMEVVTEEYTSQCCGRCGKLDNVYINREKHCQHCSAEINRDINGARNILIKNYKCWLNY